MVSPLSPRSLDYIDVARPTSGDGVQILREGIAKAMRGGICSGTFFKEGVALLFGPRFLPLLERFPEAMGRRDVLFALAMISHGTTLSDLEALEKRRGELPPEVFEKIGGGEGRAPLLRFFREPLSFLLPGSAPLWLEIESLAALRCGITDEEKKRIAIVRQDYMEREMAQRWARHGEESLFAPQEKRARLLGYATPEFLERGAVLSFCLVREGRLVQADYILKEAMNRDGLVAQFWVPLERLDLPPQLIFRGTRPTDAGSIVRDLDLSGVGKTVFQREVATLLQWIRSAKSQELDVMGHSLGGADTQRLLAAIAAAAAEQGDFSSLTAVRGYSFCPPRLDQSTLDRWEFDTQVLGLRAKSPSFSLLSAWDPHDPVPKAGDGILSLSHAPRLQGRWIVTEISSEPIAPPPPGWWMNPVLWRWKNAHAHHFVEVDGQRRGTSIVIYTEEHQAAHSHPLAGTGKVVEDDYVLIRKRVERLSNFERDVVRTPAANPAAQPPITSPVGLLALAVMKVIATKLLQIGRLLRAYSRQGIAQPAAVPHYHPPSHHEGHRPDCAVGAS